MFVRRLFVFTASVSLSMALVGSSSSQETGSHETGQWRAPHLGEKKTNGVGDSKIKQASGEEPAGSALSPIKTPARQPIARVTKGSGTLPNDHGQVWRDYDITPYTLRVTSTNRPEQAIVDWV